MPQPTKDPTPAEYKVLGCLFILVLTVGGAVLLYLGYRAPADKARLASLLIKTGWGAVGLSLVAGLLWTAFNRWMR